MSVWDQLPWRDRLYIRVTRAIDNRCCWLANCGWVSPAVLIWRVCGLWN